MFEELESTELDVAEEALYRVGLRLYERDRFPTWRQWLADRPPSSDPGAVSLAERILDTLERVTGKPLSELADSEIRPYRRRMHEIMSARYRRETRADPARVRQILEEMRVQYGRPEERNVA